MCHGGHVKVVDEESGQPRQQHDAHCCHGIGHSDGLRTEVDQLLGYAQRFLVGDKFPDFAGADLANPQRLKSWSGSNKANR